MCEMVRRAMRRTAARTPAQRLVLMALCLEADQNGLSAPTVAEIRAHTGLAERSIRTALAALRSLEGGEVLTVAASNGGRRRATVYKIMVALEGWPPALPEGCKPCTENPVSGAKPCAENSVFDAKPCTVDRVTPPNPDSNAGVVVTPKGVTPSAPLAQPCARGADDDDLTVSRQIRALCGYPQGGGQWTDSKMGAALKRWRRKFPDHGPATWIAAAEVIAERLENGGAPPRSSNLLDAVIPDIISGAVTAEGPPAGERSGDAHAAERDRLLALMGAAS